MRLIVLTLALLALAKIYTQDQIYRTATSDALIKAYSARAISACKSDDKRLNGGSQTAYWDKPGSIDVEIGRSDLGIEIWDTGHKLWEAAYVRAYLVISPSSAKSDLKCTYDVTAGVAAVLRG